MIQVWEDYLHWSYKLFCLLHFGTREENNLDSERVLCFLIKLKGIIWSETICSPVGMRPTEFGAV